MHTETHKQEDARKQSRVNRARNDAMIDVLPTRPDVGGEPAKVTAVMTGAA